MKNFSKNIILWVIIGLLLVALFNLFQGSGGNRTASTISFSDFIAATEAGNVTEVKIRGNNIEGYLNNEDSFKKYIDNQKSHKMNTYKIEKDLLKRIKNEFKQSLKEMNYSTTPNNLNIIN